MSDDYPETVRLYLAGVKIDEICGRTGKSRAAVYTDLATHGVYKGRSVYSAALVNRGPDQGAATRALIRELAEKQKVIDSMASELRSWRRFETAVHNACVGDQSLLAERVRAIPRP